MAGISFYIAFEEMKITQIAQVNQLLQLLNLVGMQANEKRCKL